MCMFYFYRNTKHRFQGNYCVYLCTFTNSFLQLLHQSSLSYFMENGIFFSSMIHNPYTPIWNKYRPALLNLMKAAADGPQEYKFSSHELKGINPKSKTSCAFELQVFQGKAINSIKNSDIAHGLLNMLQQSRTATELMDTAMYSFLLDKQYMLHIERQEAPTEQK